MRNGIAIALAWPDTLCKQAGAWYDKPLSRLGINKNNYYKVGHAAIVLIENETGDCHYFDFGRYHAPHQQGRVRSAFTDHDLEIETKAIIRNNKIINYDEILLELYHNESCHGTGNLHASYCSIVFEKALRKAKQMQNNSPIAYGPFLPYGTNCSRFVNTIVLAGKPGFLFKLVLTYPKTLSPTPIGNVKALTLSRIISTENEFEKPTNKYFQALKQNTNEPIRSMS